MAVERLEREGRTRSGSSRPMSPTGSTMRSCFVVVAPPPASCCRCSSALARCHRQASGYGSHSARRRRPSTHELPPSPLRAHPVPPSPAPRCGTRRSRCRWRPSARELLLAPLCPRAAAGAPLLVSCCRWKGRERGKEERKRGRERR
ncbi:Os03g0438900 [Oryza sativa Japonica Group]|uniref:Expressed protein n=2 Tax=Oryza sativa subsp. japonica TaxID=39947 RepID=Q10J10_ORYSJ|nr:expressed protein [Oryza sativa Japonica Group]KAB8092327.1 hypothetical protein EE612_018324 [Oryza sativa]BAF12364.1 Os03g0438900 [Oryza sativa Japonica Group]BAG99135.1 unnamed protein product [Oryza sativa Japonica Group]BAS84859.1 Os03g0438900 [Oryza sativa Japonica Group]|eukprot:NP_001050450.1 Os03g0438900 [Oryza sativa Japonica Group]